MCANNNNTRNTKGMGNFMQNYTRVYIVCHFLGQFHFLEKCIIHFLEEVRQREPISQTTS